MPHTHHAPDAIFKLEIRKNAFAPCKRLAIKYLGKIKKLKYAV